VIVLELGKLRLLNVSGCECFIASVLLVLEKGGNVDELGS
jgi:hypothetical protein